MSMDHKSIPVINDINTLNEVAKKYGIEIINNDPFSLMKFATKYEAIVRYEYADAMLEARG